MASADQLWLKIVFGCAVALEYYAGIGIEIGEF